MYNNVNMCPEKIYWLKMGCSFAL